MFNQGKTSLSPQERQVLAEKFVGLVKKVASKMSVALPRQVDRGDLVQHGAIGLMEALQRFNPDKGIQLQTFATSRIRGAILDALRGQDWVSRGARRRSRQLGQHQEMLCQELGRTPSTAELATCSGLARSEVVRRRLETARGFLASLDEVRPSQDGTEERLGDSLKDDQTCVEDQGLSLYLRGPLRQAMSRLTARERQILHLYYFEGQNTREVGVRLGVTEARISQLHTRTLAKLRSFLENGTAAPVRSSVAC